LAISNETISVFSKEKDCTKYVKKRKLDNAIIENFFGILKSELFYLKKHIIRPIKRK
jgi:transposase InsO family protein